MESHLEQLERLVRLLDQGALTPQEFQAEKARLLGIGASQGDIQKSLPGPTGTTHDVRPSRPRRAAVAAAVVIVIAAFGGGTAFYYHGQRPPEQIVQSRPVPQPIVSTASQRIPVLPAPEQVPLILDEDIKFSDPSNCQASSATDSLFNRVMTPPNGDVANISSKAIHIGADRRKVRPVLTRSSGENAGEQIFEGSADFPQPATWHGLRVRGVSASLYIVPEADSTYTRQIRFLEDPATVRSALNKQGFAVSLSPQYTELQDDACGGSMQIVAISGGSALQCSWGC